jgi:hypothetical protein
MQYPLLTYYHNILVCFTWLLLAERLESGRSLFELIAIWGSSDLGQFLFSIIKGIIYSSKIYIIRSSQISQWRDKRISLNFFFFFVLKITIGTFRLSMEIKSSFKIAIYLKFSYLDVLLLQIAKTQKLFKSTIASYSQLLDNYQKFS